MEFFGSYPDELGLHARRAGCSYDNLVSDDKAVGEFVCVDLRLTHEKACKGSDLWSQSFPFYACYIQTPSQEFPLFMAKPKIVKNVISTISLFSSIYLLCLVNRISRRHCTKTSTTET